jgi:hypothetical protein
VRPCDAGVEIHAPQHDTACADAGREILQRVLDVAQLLNGDALGRLSLGLLGFGENAIELREAAPVALGAGAQEPRRQPSRSSVAWKSQRDASGRSGEARVPLAARSA